MSLADVIKLLEKAKEGDLVGPSFQKELEKSIITNYKNEYTGRKDAFTPSSLYGCERKIYYKLTGVETEDTRTSELIGICESGTFRHAALQEYIIQIQETNDDCIWIDPEVYIKYAPVEGTRVDIRQGNEVRFYNEIYNMSFMCDGIVRYKNKYYILEIKTETSYKYNKHDEPHRQHKNQVAAYSLGLGIRNVLFIYENRDNCSKKVFHHVVTDEDIDEIKNIIKGLTQSIKLRKLPVNSYIATDVECRYCDYKERCKKGE